MAADLEHLDPQTKAALMPALDELRKAGIGFSVTSGFRDPAKQEQLWENRATNPYPVAMPGTSPHEQGLAIDLVLQHEELRPKANAILSRYGFAWGGHFKRPDPIHYQFQPDTSPVPLLPGIARTGAAAAPLAAAVDANLHAAPPPDRLAALAHAVDENLGTRKPAGPLANLAAAVDENLGRPAPGPKTTPVAKTPAPALFARPRHVTASTPEPSPRHVTVAGVSPSPPGGVGDLAQAGGQMLGGMAKLGAAGLNQLNRIDFAATAAVNRLATEARESAKISKARARQGSSFTEQFAQNVVPFAGAARNLPEARRNFDQAVEGAAREAARVYKSGEAVPPKLLRNLGGFTREKTPGGLYWPLASADVLLGLENAPSNVVIGPAWERAVSGAGRLLKPGVTAAGQKLRAVLTPAQAAIAAKLPQVAPGVYAAPDETRRLALKGLELLARATGSFKKAMVSNPATAVTNIGSNLAASELAARRAGVNPALILANLGPAAREVMAAAKGQVSQDVAEFAQHSGAWQGTLGATTQVPTVTGSKLTRAIGALPNLLTDFHSASEQASKLALYKALKSKLPPEEAARLVQQHLFDYSDVPRLLAAGEKYGLTVFATYPYKATLLLGNTLLHRPDLLARYPKMRALLLQQAGVKNDEGLPAHAQGGTFLIPVAGGRRWIDLSRWHPFAEGLDSLKKLAAGEPALPQSTPELLDALMGKTIFSGAYSALAERNLLTHKPLVAPGTPPDVAGAQKLQALRESYSPSLLPPYGRGFERIKNAAQGRPNSKGPNAEAQSLGEALLQAVVGVPVLTAEGPEEKAKRMAPTLSARARVSGRYLATLAPHVGEMPNPYTADLARVESARDLSQRLRTAQQNLRQQIQAGELFDRSGQLTPAGRDRLRQQLQFFAAIAGRLQEVARKPRR